MTNMGRTGNGKVICLPGYQQMSSGMLHLHCTKNTWKLFSTEGELCPKWHQISFILDNYWKVFFPFAATVIMPLSFSKISHDLVMLLFECLHPPQIHMLNSNLEGDSIRRWSLCELIRSWSKSPHEWDLCHYKRGLRKPSCPPPPCENTARSHRLWTRKWVVTETMTLWS